MYLHPALAGGGGRVPQTLVSIKKEIRNHFWWLDQASLWSWAGRDAGFPEQATDGDQLPLLLPTLLRGPAEVCMPWFTLAPHGQELHPPGEAGKEGVALQGSVHTQGGARR